MQPANTCSQCGRVVGDDDSFCSGCGSLLSSSGTATRAVHTPPPNGTHQPEGPFPRGMLLGQGGRYGIERRLGKGGFGEAYLAYDTQLGQRPCVVKRLVNSRSWSASTWQVAQQNFEREAQLLVSLNTPGHPNIPEIYEYLPDSHCLVMKYIAGQSLLHALKRRTDPLPENDALRYARDVCAALVYMHSRTPEPVLHRDLKPDNILLDAEGRVWVIDFGLAKALPSQAAHTKARRTQASGTPGYAPPEQWRNAAEPRSDVYALATTLYTLLTNRQPPSDHASIAALLQGQMKLSSVRQFNPGVHPAVEQLIARGMALDAAARPSAQEFLAELEALVAQPSIPKPPDPARPPAIAGFVGRMGELQTYGRQLAESGLAVIVGLAGVGKTALAATLARQNADEHRVFWHAFHEEEGVDNLIWRLAAFLASSGQDQLWRLLHNRGTSGGPPPEVLIDYAVQLLRGRGFVLWLDDFQYVEHDQQITGFVDRLRAELRPGNIAMIITSRHRPRFLPSAFAQLGGLSPGDGHRLLITRGLTLPAELAGELVQATAGNAQLLTLASGALKQTTDPARLVARIAEAGDIEQYLMREVDEHLTDGERAVMAAVAILLGHGGTRDAIEAVLDGAPAARALQSLSDRSLLTVIEGDPGPEYGQHAIVQSFYYRLLGRRERQAMHQRAGAYYETETGDMLRAARHFERAGEYDRAARLASSDVWGIINRGQAQELRRLLEQLAERSLDTGSSISVAFARAQVYTLLAEGQLARTSYELALAELQALGDTPAASALTARACRGMGELLEHEAPQEALRWLQRGLEAAGENQPLEAAAIHLRIGSVLTVQGDYTAARAACEKSLRQLPPGADDWRASALIKLGVIHCSQGDIAHGTVCYREALEIYQRLGNIWGMIGARHNLGIEMDIAGDWAGAFQEYQQALELARQLGDMGHQAECLLSMGICCTKQGDFEAAHTHLAACIDLAERHQMFELLVGALSSLADLLLRRGDLRAAEAALARVRQLALEINMRYQLPEIYREWAQLYLAQGDAQAAHAEAERSLELARELEMDLDIGLGLRVLGQALLASGRCEQALDAFAGSLELLEGRDPYEAARTQMEWGAALLAGQDREQGAELLRAARAAFERLGARRELELGA